MKLSFLISVLKNDLTVSGDVDIQSIVIDSRKVQAGDVFFAIKGNQYDGHDFVEVAVKNGAIAVVVSHSVNVDSQCVISVEDTIHALGTLAKAWREKINPHLIGITGSNGKTTVKEMITAMLEKSMGKDAVLSTQGNFNNHIGLPLTLLRLKENHRVAVIEMGMNHFGELRYLTKIAQPNTVIITNILRAHIGCGFDGLKDIAKAKSEIFEGLKQEGLVILPKDDTQYDTLMNKVTHGKVVTFGVNQADVRAENIILGKITSEFHLVTPKGNFSICLPVPGMHNILNVLSSIAALVNIPVSLDQIKESLEGFQMIGGRLKLLDLPGGGVVIDDTYNANPDSMKASIDVLSRFPSPRIFVMGSMGELGEGSGDMHYEVGQYALELGIDIGLFIGEDTLKAKQAFVGEGSFYFSNKDHLLQQLKSYLGGAPSILVKGSHFMKMDEIVLKLVNF